MSPLTLWLMAMLLYSILIHHIWHKSDRKISSQKPPADGWIRHPASHLHYNLVTSPTHVNLTRSYSYYYYWQSNYFLNKLTPVMISSISNDISVTLIQTIIQCSVIIQCRAAWLFNTTFICVLIAKTCSTYIMHTTILRTYDSYLCWPKPPQQQLLTMY